MPRIAKTELDKQSFTFAANVKYELFRTGLTQSELADRIGLSLRALSCRLNHDPWRFTVREIQLIGNALNTPWRSLFLERRPVADSDRF